MLLAKQSALSWVEFQQKFATEEACRQHLFKMRWPNGFQCPKCGNKRAYPLSKRKLYECTACGYQASVTAGTIMHRTRTPLVIWFWVIYLVSTDKRGVSAKYLSEHFDISYPTAWLILHKIRKAMADRESNYTLAGIVEMDDAFFGAPTEGGKRGRGTEKVKAIAGLSLTPKGYPQYLKIKVVGDLKSATLVGFANQEIAKGATISTDLYRSYNKLSKEGYNHISKEFNHKEDPDHLKWLHTVISNAKAFIGGTFHGLGPKHLQYYFAEFCYRFNRRKYKGQLFNRLLNACVSTTTVTYNQLVKLNLT